VQLGFKNAHGTVFRELIYHWHPWFGMRVAIHEAIDKADGIVFRCTLSGSAADRWLESASLDVRPGEVPRSAAADRIAFC
jgi:hypothetical protein